MTPMPSNTAVLFPGQGSHSEGMQEPFADHPLLVRGIELLGFDPFDNLSAGTRSHQPALFLCSMAQWASRDDREEDPLAAAGHSLGEYAALTAAGAIDFEDAVRLVGARATAMAAAAEREPGGMVAMLGGERDDVYELAAELGLSLANDNAPGQIVLSGRVDAIDQALERADQIGCRA
ncbi:MAG: [acyl-carrier-protein] S-malonyltransferase, partial [Solirubrobacteraceae bacterium]|nr:[acyl-carrier-protein] S-malonyltransferase [Solirubrobacteraceae bacterium]